MLERKSIDQLIPCKGEKYDVIVAGSGPAGFGAAMAAAKTNAKTLLLESAGLPGGIAGFSLWMPINRLRTEGSSRGGVHEMLVSKLESFGPMASKEGEVSWVCGDGLNVHPEYLRLAMLELLEEAGCHYRMHSPVVDAQVVDGVIRSVDVQCAGVRERFEGDVFIDCTGDGVLSAVAGAEIEVGHETTGMMMPVTLGFAICNVDVETVERLEINKNLKAYTDRAIKDGYTVSKWYGFSTTTVPGVISINNGGAIGADGELNALNIGDRTFAERIGLQIAIDFVRFAREYQIPGLEDCYLMRTGDEVSVRETRRVIGDYVFTLDDAQRDTDFEDIIAKRYGAVDQAGLSANTSGGSAGSTVEMRSGHGYPYRSLLVKGIEGLLVAGRCGSYTHIALAAGKSMGNMMAIGQAAGAAAALSSQLHMTPRQLPYHVLREKLDEMNIKL